MSLVLLFGGAAPFAPDVQFPAVGSPWAMGWSINRAAASGFVSTVEKPSIDYLLGSRTTLRCVAVDTRPDTANAFRPAPDQEISVVRASDGVLLFAGTIVEASDVPLGEPNVGSKTYISAVGHEAIEESRFISPARTFGTDPVPLAFVLGTGVSHTLEPHGLSVGNVVRIEGMVNSGGGSAPLGDYTVTAVAGTFDFTINFTGTGSNGGGTVRGITYLKTVIQALVNDYLSQNGIILSMSANGPALEKLVFEGTVEEAMRTALDIAGWVKRYLPTKVLEVFEPGTVTAPFSLTGANIKKGLRWGRVSTNSGNRIILKYGDNRVADRTDYFYGNGVKRVFPLTYKPVQTGVNASPGTVFDYTANAPRHVGVWGFDTLFEWVYRASDNALVQMDVWASTPSTPLPTGATIKFTYGVQFPQELPVQDDVLVASQGPRELKYEEPTGFDASTARQLAQAYLRKAKLTPPKKISAAPTQVGLEFPGSKIAVSVPERVLSGDYLIMGVSITERNDGLLYYTYQGLEGLEPLPNWVDYFKGRTGRSTGGGSSAGGGVVPAPAPSPTFVTGQPVYFLGGTGLDGYQSAVPTWVDLSQLRVRIDTTKRTSVDALVSVQLKSADVGTTVQARLFNVTDNVPCAGVSAVVSWQDWVTVTFVTTLSPGQKYYKLQGLPSVANSDVYGVGTLE